MAQRDDDAPRAAGHEARRYRERAQGPATALAPREHARQEQLKRPLELLSGGRLRQIQPLDHRLGGSPRLERGIAPASQIKGQQPRMSETLCDDARGETRHLPQREDPGLLEELGQRLELEAGAQQRDRQRSEEIAQTALLHDT